MLASRHIQSAWIPVVVHILLPFMTRSSVPEDGERSRDGRRRRRKEEEWGGEEEYLE